MPEIYISWLGSYRQRMSNVMTANVKCIVTWLYVTKKRKNIFMAPFYGWGSTMRKVTKNSLEQVVKDLAQMFD